MQRLRAGKEIPMSKEKTKEEIIRHKKNAIHKLNLLLESYITSDTKELLKKADLMSYWIEEFSDYIKEEHNFDPKRLKSYKRGDVVKLNFGFNIGSEYGGLHYAIVINNKNPRNSSVLTVIPLTSLKSTEDQIHPDDVFLGNEIYKALKLKYDTISQNLEHEQRETDEYQKAFSIAFEIAKDKVESVKVSDSDSPTFEQDLQDAQKYIAALHKIEEILNQKIADNAASKQQLDKIGAEISHMKAGSVALVSSIMTVSKMRIYDPRNARGVLNGIRLSEDGIEKINKKLKELFIHE